MEERPRPHPILFGVPNAMGADTAGPTPNPTRSVTAGPQAGHGEVWGGLFVPLVTP